MKNDNAARVALATKPYWSIYARVYRDHRLAARKSSDSGCRAYCEEVLRALRTASVVYLPSEQVDAIPRIGNTYEQEALALRGMRPPFPTTFLAIGGEWVNAEEDWRDAPLYAALILDGDPAKVLPFFLGPIGTTSGWGAGFVTERDGRYGIATATWLPDVPIPPARPGAADTMKAEAEECVAGGATRALRSLFLLESANVSLSPADPAPRAHRGVGRPSFEVVIRQRRSAMSNSTVGGASEWSHRWEVRGHFKHFHSGFMFDRHEGRRVADADGEQCVRIWCPPHIKGPEEMPFVPKVRLRA